MGSFYQFGQTDEIEVELASAWRRIGAGLINFLILMIVCVVPYIALISSPELLFRIGIFGVLALIGLLVLILSIMQMWYLGKSGQSIGKKVMGIRVIKENGEWAGFFSAVFLREIIFWIIVSVVMNWVSHFLFANNELYQQLSSMMTNPMSLQQFPLELESGNLDKHMIILLIILILKVKLVENLPSLICLLMLFIQKDRKTLQDFFASTIVIKLPK